MKKTAHILALLLACALLAAPARAAFGSATLRAGDPPRPWGAGPPPRTGFEEASRRRWKGTPSSST